MMLIEIETKDDVAFLQVEEIASIVMSNDTVKIRFRTFGTEPIMYINVLNIPEVKSQLRKLKL
jgi:hypothetical protein